MTWIPYDGAEYLDFDGVVSTCESLAEAHPDWVALETIGTSRQGRPILMLTVSRQDGGIGDRPAFWLDGATHCAEWAGVMAALYSVSRWVEALTTGNAAETAWFSAHAIHVVPVISVDGYVHMHAGGHFVRSTLRPPRDGRPRFGLDPCDIDHDGEIRWMRWRHPTGPYTVDHAHPAGFRLRNLDDNPDDACFVATEGQFLFWDGARWLEADREFGLDLNRNFPGSWRPQSMFGMDGGIHPLSEPESRAIVDAVAARPRIGAALTNHTFTGALLTQPYRPDSPLGKPDLRTMERLAKDAARGTDYRVLRVHPDFTYDTDNPIAGVWADTLSTVFGIPGYTLELWDPYRFAGTEVPDLGTFFLWPDQDVLDKLFDAFAKEIGGWVPWNVVQHPQLGVIEVGGLRHMRTIRNPPDRLLPAECERGFLVADRMRRALPRVVVYTNAELVGDDIVRLEAIVENQGFLPTGGTRHAETIGAAAPIHLSLETDGVIVDGEPEVNAGWLDGWGSHQVEGAAQRLYPRLPARGARARVTWVVRGGRSLRVRWDAGRAGAGVTRV